MISLRTNLFSFKRERKERETERKRDSYRQANTKRVSPSEKEPSERTGYSELEDDFLASISNEEGIFRIAQYVGKEPLNVTK